MTFNSAEFLFFFPLMLLVYAVVFQRERWREMVLLKRKFRQPDREMLDQLAAQLSALSPRNQPW